MQVIPAFVKKSGLQRISEMQIILQQLLETKTCLQGEGPGGLLHGHLDARRRRDRLERRCSHIQLRPAILRHPCAKVRNSNTILIRV